MGHFAGEGGPARPPGLREPAGAISRERDLCVFATPAPEGPKKMGVMVEMKKTLAIFKTFVYTNICCDMIAMKREVAAD